MDILNKLAVIVLIFFLVTDIYAFQKSTTNIALLKTVAASSEEELSSNAVDGNSTSYWQSGSYVGDHWLEVDLEGFYTIDRVVLPLVKGIDSLVVEVRTNDRWKTVFTGKPDNPLIGFEPLQASRVRLHSIDGKQMRVYEVQVFQYDPQPVFVNQSGYDLYKYKRFTAPLATDNTRFIITESDRSTVLFEGEVNDHIGDFTSFQPKDDPGPYVVKVMGSEETGISVPFKIGLNWIEKVSYQPAIDFMIDVRCWFGDSRNYSPTDENSDCYENKGVAWRDSHQFSFEIQSLLHLYFANPSAFTADRMPIQGEYLGLREELPKDTPEIVRLIYWAVDIYLRGEVNHTLLKEQLAYFVYAWPWLSEYIPKNVYVEARDYVFSIWGSEKINRWGWFDIDHTGDLFQTYTIFGTGKGEFPNGHSIVPNLMMFEVAKREGREDANKFFKAAYDQTIWLIENMDWNDPQTTKGLRAGEWVTITSFEYFLKHYPDKAPKGLKEKIIEWSDIALERSDNMWDYRRYSDERWIIPTVGHPGHPYLPEFGYNEPGNVAGFPAIALAVTSIINDTNLQDRLRQLGTAHVDHVFGRNPTGRHFSFDAKLDFEGVELGWFQEYQGGYGILQPVRGVLDGSPKETTYPYNPYAGDPVHTEGWVTFNAAWNVGLAYISTDVISIKVYDTTFENEIDSVKPADNIGIEITAPLNFDYEHKEKAEAVIYLGNQEQKVELKEISASSMKFRGTFRIPDRVESQTAKISYGYAWHEKMKELTIE